MRCAAIWSIDGAMLTRSRLVASGRVAVSQVDSSRPVVEVVEPVEQQALVDDRAQRLQALRQHRREGLGIGPVVRHDHAEVVVDEAQAGRRLERRALGRIGPAHGLEQG
jgi:hypothetical protein